MTRWRDPVFPFWQIGITVRSMARMHPITIKLSEATIRRLKSEAKLTGRSIGQLIRDCIEGPRDSADSVHALATDLAGSVAGSGRSATNDRVRFRRS